MKRDSQYLEKKNFSLLDKQHNELNYNDLDWDNLNAVNFNYKVMQRPGRLNALGALKFLFPNDYSVYLHDTPAKQYFNKEIRAYSHGCVRLEKPAEFADYIIREMDELEDIESVNGLIKNGTTYKINLKQPVRIAIRYYTCEADADNNLLFLSDIYNKDKPMIEQILN
jgi:murein L,D-transpeptidase YcbB/YkuD